MSKQGSRPCPKPVCFCIWASFDPFEADTTRETTYNDQKLATTHNMWSSCGIPHQAKAYTVNTTTKLNPVVVQLLVWSLTGLLYLGSWGKKSGMPKFPALIWPSPKKYSVLTQ